jgi:hypothetical protein
VHIGLGDTDRAFEWLQKGLEARDWQMALLKVEPAFDGLRSSNALAFQDRQRQASPAGTQTVARLRQPNTFGNASHPQVTEQQLLKQSRGWGLTNRRGCPLTSQAIGVLLRNQLYAGIVDVTKYGVRGNAAISSR